MEESRCTAVLLLGQWSLHRDLTTCLKITGETTIRTPPGLLLTVSLGQPPLDKMLTNRFRLDQPGVWVRAPRHYLTFLNEVLSQKRIIQSDVKGQAFNFIFILENVKDEAGHKCTP